MANDKIQEHGAEKIESSKSGEMSLAASQKLSNEFIANTPTQSFAVRSASPRDTAQGSDGFQISNSAPAISGFLETPGNGEVDVHTAIDNASKSVDMWMYHLTDQGTVKSLIDAHNRGVDVKVILDQASLNTPSFALSYKQLQAAGVDVRPSSQAFSISHAKTMLVDGDSSYITSINLTKIPGVTRDFGVETEDPMIAQDLQKMFDADWQDAQTNGSDTPAPSSPFLVISPIQTDLPVQKLQDNQNQIDAATSSLSAAQKASANGDFAKATAQFSSLDQLAAEKDLSKLPNGNELVQLFAERMQLNQIDRIKSLIDHAQNSIVGETENLGAPEIQSSLIAAVKRGVDVELIIPEENRGANGNASAVQELLAAGVHVKEMPGPSSADKPYVHAKWLVRDQDKEAYLGSINYTRNSLNHAREIGLIMYDANSMHKMTNDFQHDWSVADSPPFAIH